MKQQHNNRHPPCGCHGEDERLTEIKFVGIEFDQRKIPSQESELNRCIQSDYHILERVQTATGLVFLLGKFEYTSPLPKIEGEDYCFPKIPDDAEVLDKIQRGAEVA